MDGKGAVQVGGQPQPEVTVRRPRSVIAFACSFAVGAGVAYLGLIVLGRLSNVVLLVGFAMLIALTLDPVVSFLERRGTRRSLAAFATWLIVVVLLSAPIVLAVDAATTQLPTLIHSGPTLIRNAEDHLGALGDKLRSLTTTSGTAQAHFNPTKVIDYILKSGRLIFSALTDVVVVAFLSLYFAIELPKMRDLLLRAFPSSRRVRAAGMVDELRGLLGRYMLSTVLIAVLCGIGTTVWSLSWGIPYPVLLGALVAVLGLVPVVGSTVGGAIVTLVSLTVGLPTAVATLVFYIGYRMAEDYLIQPRIMRYSVELPGVITVPSVLLGGAILGIPGALFAVPVALVVRTLVRELVLPAADRH